MYSATMPIRYDGMLASYPYCGYEAKQRKLGKRETFDQEETENVELRGGAGQVSTRLPTATSTTGSLRTARSTAEVPGEEEGGGAVCLGVWGGRRGRSCESVAAAL